MSMRRVAVVTGAAQGIGAAITRRLLADGYNVAAIDVDAERLNEFSSQFPSGGPQVHPIVWDLTDLALAPSVIERIINQFGRIDILVNNAAWREVVTMRDVTLDSWDRTLRVCLTAPAFLAREAARCMEQAGSGVIVNIGSMMAAQAAGFAPAYVASKAAIEALTYDLAALYGPHGIRVVTVSPGAIDTRLSADLAPESVAAEELQRHAESMTMLGRLGTAEEVAASVVWAASDEASYLTGTTITLDGGWTRHHLPTPLFSKLFEAQRP